jgi:hypothetical protein
MHTFLFAALAAISLPALAQVHICKTPDGNTVFQDSPCSVHGSDAADECDRPMSYFESRIQSGKGNYIDQRCLDRLQGEARVQARLEAEAKEKERKEALRQERLAEAEKARAARITAELRAEREAKEDRERQIQRAKDMGMYYVEYRVTGSAPRAGITIRNAVGGTEQHEVSMGWSMSFPAQPGQFLYLSAQNKAKSGDVRAAIFINGLPMWTATATEDYGIAQVDARL